MTTLREAATMALEACTDVVSGWESLAPLAVRRAAVESLDALRTALAEPEQEPVAWVVYTEGGTAAYVTNNPKDLVGAYRALPLYTAPSQHKPLTDEEIHDCWQQKHRDKVTERRLITRAIERAHGIGGQE